LKTQAALVSRQATSLALKSSLAKELLDKLQKAIHNLDLEADIYLSEKHEKSNEISPSPNESVQQPSNGVISFRIPEVVKGPKNTRFKNVVEKNAGKKKKKVFRKRYCPLVYTYIYIFLIFHYLICVCIYYIVGNDLQIRDGHVGPSSTMDFSFVQAGYANSTMTQFNSFDDPSTMAVPFGLGEYTNLLMRVDQDASLKMPLGSYISIECKNNESM
jgi:hypothetical protein